eukprot:3377954-Amphidinium_carterae.1
MNKPPPHRRWPNFGGLWVWLFRQPGHRGAMTVAAYAIYKHSLHRYTIGSGILTDRKKLWGIVSVNSSVPPE